MQELINHHIVTGEREREKESIMSYKLCQQICYPKGLRRDAPELLSMLKLGVLQRCTKDALCRYQGITPESPKRGRADIKLHDSADSLGGVKPPPSLDRARLARARRLLHPSPELSQADPLPVKDDSHGKILIDFCICWRCFHQDWKQHA